MHRLLTLFSAAWGQVIVAAITIASLRAYTELMTTADFGAAMLAQGLVALIEGATLLAFSQTVLTRSAALAERHRRPHFSIDLTWSFARRTIPVLIGLSAAASVIWAIARPGPGAFLPLLLLPVYFTTECFKYTIQSLLLLDLRYARLSCWYAVEATLVTGATIGLLLNLKSGPVTFLTGYFLGRIIASSFFLASEFRLIISRRKTRLQKDAERDAWRFGRNVAAMGPLGWISSYLDRYILGASLSTSAAGIYVATSGLAIRPFNLTSTVLTNYFRPQFQSATEEGVQPQYERTLRRWIGSSLGVGCSAVALAVLAGEPITDLLLAPEYRVNAQYILVIFCIAQTFTISTHAADNMILAAGRSRTLLRTQTALSLCTIIFIPLGAISAGLLGAVAGRALAEFCKFAAALLVARRSTCRQYGSTGLKR